MKLGLPMRGMNIYLVDRLTNPERGVFWLGGVWKIYVMMCSICNFDLLESYTA